VNLAAPARAHLSLSLDLKSMAAQMSSTHLHHEAAPSEDIVAHRRSMALLAFGALAGLMMVGASLRMSPSGHDTAFAFSPAVPGLGLRRVKNGGLAAQAAMPVMQVGTPAAMPYSPGVASSGFSAGVAETPAVAIPPPQLVQGGSLRTWTYRSPAVEQVQVILSTEGRPLDADIELWHGPDNTPTKLRVYVENGQMRPFSAVVETPRGPNTVAIRNIGQIEFPIAANVVHGNVDQPSPECLSTATTVQGGALRTYPFDPNVDSVQVMLTTDGRPLNARIELLQGPNNNKQVIELYSEDGRDRPFFTILETPGAGNVIRVVNTAPVEFPMTASVVPNSINENSFMGAELGGDVVIGGDVGF